MGVEVKYAMISNGRMQYDHNKQTSRRSGERGYSDPHPSKVAGEPPYHQGVEAEQINCCVVGSFRRKGGQGGRA